MYPNAAPSVFIIKSSTSKHPSFVTNCMVSTQRLSAKPENVIKKKFLVSLWIMGRINPNGINPTTFPTSSIQPATHPTVPYTSKIV